MDTNFDAETLHTRTRLILAAERLFGERGIDAVPLRDVVVAAGQRNASALNYHIGGREELVRAILDFRRSAVDARRFELLGDSMTRHGIMNEGENMNEAAIMHEGAIAAVMISPLVELMQRDAQGGNYLCFLSQVYVTERPEAALRPTGDTDLGMRRCYQLYQALHPEVAEGRLRERFTLCGRSVIYALADWLRDTTHQRSSNPRTSLVDFSASLISVTASSLASIRESEDRCIPASTISG